MEIKGKKRNPSTIVTSHYHGKNQIQKNNLILIIIPWKLENIIEEIQNS